MCELQPEKPELWDLVDDQRRPLGRTHVRGEALEPGEYHLVVHLCLFNDAGELLIQKRQKTKASWPDFWDVSVGGAVQAGEDSRKAMVRETQEELGLALNLDGKRPLMTVNFSRGFDDWWVLRQNVSLSELKLQQEEVAAARWASRKEVQELAEQGKFIPCWFLDALFERIKQDPHFGK